MKQILAIGGGGFSRYGVYNSSNLVMEKHFLSLSHKSSPRVCFIPTASGEAMKYIVDFYRAFGNFDCKPSHLSLFEPPSADLESFILSHDAVYVGGGNTKSMLALWKEWKLDHILKKAWEQGVVLGGVSAGAMCWFEEGITDSIPGTLTPLKCLGYLKGSFCPHYDAEKERRPAYQQWIQKGLSEGVAADDQVALHYVDHELKHVVKASGQGAAFRVRLHNGQIVEEKMKVQTL